MKIPVIASLALALTGCALLQQLEGTSGAGGSSAASSGAGGTQGLNCGVDPDTSATLCLGISLCPGLTVDQEAYPQCGFRVSGQAIDVECSCGGLICALGATATCDQAKQLLADQNKGTVCAQVSAGVCTEGVPAGGAAATGASSSASGGGTCDTTCRTECGGDPTCIQSCGC